MQHQYWVTKKSVLRKLGGKEDECVVSSDAELDAKLELFRSISDSCVHLQRIIDLYQERLCYLAQEENALGRYLKECGKNEKNASAGLIMETAGKALAYTGRQRLNIRPPLVRLHHEVETFRGRAVSDTRSTVLEMEKARTEYRAALSWMKSASQQLDPDTGNGLERFRKTQSYVRTTKVRFDRLMLACLQKVDLLAAARCNMFSHALISYQKAINTFSAEAGRILNLAAKKLDNVEPYDFSAVSELALPQKEKVDKDENTFFNAEYTDKDPEKQDKKDVASTNEVPDASGSDTNLLGEDFTPSSLPEEPSENATLSSELLGLSWPATASDFIGGEFMPSKLLHDGELSIEKLTIPHDAKQDAAKEIKDTPSKKGRKNNANVSWLSLFAELDPLSSQNEGVLGSTGDRA